jgi:hypothetical protein
MFGPHRMFMCSVRIWEQTAIISLYSINWLVFITETECVYCAVRTGSLYIILVRCFVWIWEQTAIISLYSINWLVFITETKCLQRGTDWIFKYNSVESSTDCLQITMHCAFTCLPSAAQCLHSYMNISCGLHSVSAPGQLWNVMVIRTANYMPSCCVNRRKGFGHSRHLFFTHSLHAAQSSLRT